MIRVLGYIFLTLIVGVVALVGAAVWFGRAVDQEIAGYEAEQAVPGIPPAQAQERGGQWFQSKDTSKFDDSTNVFLRVVADEEVWVSKYNQFRPVLWITCREDTTDIFIEFDEFLGSDDTRVEYRLDKLKAQSGRWRISSDHQAVGLWRGNTSIPFIKRLFGKTLLAVRLTPYGESQVSTTFTIYGLEDRIGDLRQACHW